LKGGQPLKGKDLAMEEKRYCGGGECPCNQKGYTVGEGPHIHLSLSRWPTTKTPWGDKGGAIGAETIPQNPIKMTERGGFYLVEKGSSGKEGNLYPLRELDSRARKKRGTAEKRGPLWSVNIITK